MLINKNKLPGIIFLVLGILLFFLIPWQIPEGSGLQHGPRLFPFIVAGVMVFCSLGLLYKDFNSKKKHHNNQSEENVDEQKQEKYWSIDLKEISGAGLFFVIMCGYVFILDKFGFILASLLFVITSLIYYGTRKWTNYIIVILITIAIYFFFTLLLKTQLP